VTTLRDITDIAGCRAVVSIQIEVWGEDGEVVPASVLLASIKRGGILVGAYEGDYLVGFVWSMPGWRDGVPTQWSHMLGVRPIARGAGLGEQLKIAQRDRALATPVDLIEWTFDPLQAQNAHLNMATLGCVATTYRVNTYGEMIGPLHRGTPTDRLVAEWWIRKPHVERRLAARTARAAGHFIARSADVAKAPSAIATRQTGEWLECLSADASLDAPRIAVPIPPRFTELQQQATDAALAWRLMTREIFLAYLSRGYRVVDFFRDLQEGGQYLLAEASKL
jgi:predicted GNAT superfamily acetyltransferase